MTNDHPLPLTPDEEAAILGITEDELMRLAKGGEVRYFEVGFRPRFDLADIRQFDRTTPIPPKSVLRSRRTGIRPRVRFQVLERDGFRCVYCGATPDTSQLAVDHAISVADGGTDDESNLVTSCFDCNAGKGRRSVPR